MVTEGNEKHKCWHSRLSLLLLLLLLAWLATSVRVLAHAPLRKRACGPQFAPRWRLIQRF